MPYENDLFISYAHLDNLPLTEDSSGWVSEFHRALEVRVAQLLGEKPQIWRDLKLSGNDAFSDVIFTTLKGTALLVSVLTPRYVQSDWCVRELLEFCATTAASGGLLINDKSRVFKVIKTPVDVAHHPEPIRPLLGYEFYKTDPDSGRIRELDRVFGPEAQREFWVQLDDLAQDIVTLLKTLDANTPEPQTPKGTVYLAQTTSDARGWHDQIRRDLQGHGYQVLPDRELPCEQHELENVVRACLTRSRLSVHIIGADFGMVPEGGRKSIIEVQNDLATEFDSRADFSRLVWIPEGLSPRDERQAAYWDALRADPRIHQGADLLESPLEDLNTHIHAVLEGPAQAASPFVEGGGDGELVYLICEAGDFSAASAVADALFNCGCSVLMPRYDGSEAALRQDHEEKLRGARGVIIYHRSGNELWLHRKVRELRRSAGLGRSEPLLATAVLVAPPASEQPGWQRLDVARILHQSGPFSPTILQDFLSDLRRRATG
jgi:hypothetical protein